MMIRCIDRAEKNDDGEHNGDEIDVGGEGAGAMRLAR